MFSRYFIHNGVISDFEKQTGNLLPLLDNIFKLTETIWFCHNNLPLFEKHIISLQEKTRLLKLPKHPFIDDQKELLRVSKRLINKNKAFQSGILMYFFVWNTTGSEIYITCTPKDEKHFPISGNGVLCSYAENVKYSENPMGSLSLMNETLWESLKLQIKDSRNQNLILTNEENAITEALEANVFFIKDGTLFTPSVHTGCYLDSIRETILEAAKKLQMNIEERSDLTKEAILEMNEAFLAAEALGMQRIIGINDKRFIHVQTELINTELNKLLGIV